jgi:hypothetical protein
VTASVPVTGLILLAHLGSGLALLEPLDPASGARPDTGMGG